MRMPEAILYTRDFSPTQPPQGVKLRVNSLEWSANGGPMEGSITATEGSEGALWELLEWLRRPVEILHPKTGRAVWWGYVHAATVRGAIEVGASLDSMVNRVAVAYSYVAVGTNIVGSRATTAWTQDDLSVGTYGIKEFLSSAGGMTPEAALGRRDAILAAQRWPEAPAGMTGGMLPKGRSRYSGAKQSRSATLTLRGWWSTLGWRYVSVPTITAVSYETTGAAEQAVGAADANAQVMQQVYIPTQTVNAVTVQVYARKVGNPVDSLRVRIYSTIEEDDDPGKIGLPDTTELGSALIAPMGIGATAEWVMGTLSTETPMEAGKKFAIVVDRVGAVDAANYFAVNVNTALGYGDGFMRIKNGATNTWAARSPDADMPFRIGVTNQVETTQQIADLVRQGGQFLRGTDAPVGSGRKVASYLNGDTTAITEIEDLLRMGGAGGRRMLASVQRNRRLLVTEEPERYTAATYMDSGGRLTTQTGKQLDDFAPPVGEWLRLRDVVPGSVDMTQLVNPEYQFVEGANWSVGAGLRLRFRGQPSIDSILEVRR